MMKQRDHNMQIMMEEDYGDGIGRSKRHEMVKVVNGDEIEQVDDEGGRDQNMHTMVNLANIQMQMISRWRMRQRIDS